MVLCMLSVKMTDLMQTKPNAELYQTLSHELLAVQREKGLASETIENFFFFPGCYSVMLSILSTNASVDNALFFYAHLPIRIFF